MKTPYELGLNLSRKHTNRKAPDGGWEPQTWYLVEVAFSNNNPIHRQLFFSGFISNGEPCGYNMFAITGDELIEYSDAVYLRVVERLFSNKEKGL